MSAQGPHPYANEGDFHDQAITACQRSIASSGIALTRCAWCAWTSRRPCRQRIFGTNEEGVKLLCLAYRAHALFKT